MIRWRITFSVALAFAFFSTLPARGQSSTQSTQPEAVVGTIEAGKRADVVILSANPLESIRNIRTVEFVVTNGVMYNCAELWRSVGFKP